MDWPLLATIGVPGAVVVAGWFFVHRLTARRELATRKREARLKALEAAYMRIATVMNRPLIPDLEDKLETFVAEIQLYGTPSQIEHMRKIVTGFTSGSRDISLDAILEDLRDTVRRELELEAIQGPVWWLRIRYVPPGSSPIEQKESGNAT